MTSHQEPHFSYTEATLRREVHTDNSHWELMYKAMLAQLMTYVDASVVRALAERGIDHHRPSTGATGRGGTQSHETGRAAPAGVSQGPRFDPSLNGSLVGIPIPPWLQPFTLPEQVRFTRTPDALLRHAPPESPDMPVDDLGGHGDDPVPRWRRPVVLPANVRFNRTPDPKPNGHESEPEVVEAQTFTDDVALAPPETPQPADGGRTLLAEAEPGLPPWFGTDRVDPATRTSDAEPGQHSSAIILEGDIDEAEDLASAWLQAHEKIVAGKPLRLTSDQTIGEVLMAVEAVALEPDASMNPYGDSRLWTASSEPEGPSPALHPFGDPAFWIEGLAEAPSAVADPASDHVSGPVGPGSLGAVADATRARTGVARVRRRNGRQRSLWG